MQSVKSNLQAAQDEAVSLQQQLDDAEQRSHADASAAATQQAALEHSNQEYRDSLAKALADMESTTASLSSTHAGEVDAARLELRDANAKRAELELSNQGKKEQIMKLELELVRRL